MVQCARDFDYPAVADAMEAIGYAGEWEEEWEKLTVTESVHCNYFNFGDQEVDVAPSPFQPQPGACVAKLHGDGQVTIAAPFAVETMEEATIRITRKLESHRWDLSVLSASERAILSRP
jgi:hypothetical protein